uniref:Secreted protein n=1 Tax=Anopheles merus TaxID=30066 RepID=A0A182US39_ANOME
MLCYAILLLLLMVARLLKKSSSKGGKHRKSRKGKKPGLAVAQPLPAPPTFFCTFRTRIGIAAKRVISRHFDTDASDVTSACSGKCHVSVADDEYSGRCCPAAYH